MATAIGRVCALSSRAGAEAGETPRLQAARFLRRQQRNTHAYLDQALHPERRARLGLALPKRRVAPRGKWLTRLMDLAPYASSVIPEPSRDAPAGMPALVANGSFATWPVTLSIESPSGPSA